MRRVRLRDRRDAVREGQERGEERDTEEKEERECVLFLRVCMFFLEEN